MKTGYVKFFNKRRHFGFIVPDGVAKNDRARQVFFYETTIEGDVRDGDAVEFVLNPNYPELRALQVRSSGKQRSYTPINEGRKGAYGTD